MVMKHIQYTVCCDGFGCTSKFDACNDVGANAAVEMSVKLAKWERDGRYVFCPSCVSKRDGACEEDR